MQGVVAESRALFWVLWFGFCLGLGGDAQEVDVAVPGVGVAIVLEKVAVAVEALFILDVFLFF